MMSDGPMITFMRQPKPSSDYVTTRTRVARMSVTPTRNCFVRKKTNHTLGEPSESSSSSKSPFAHNSVITDQDVSQANKAILMKDLMPGFPFSVKFLSKQSRRSFLETLGYICTFPRWMRRHLRQGYL